LLTNPTWGVLQYAKITAQQAILDIAALHRAAAAGDMPEITRWSTFEWIHALIELFGSPDLAREYIETKVARMLGGHDVNDLDQP
jgi:hypothetical protein